MIIVMNEFGKRILCYNLLAYYSFVHNARFNVFSYVFYMFHKRKFEMAILKIKIHTETRRSCMKPVGMCIFF